VGLTELGHDVGQNVDNGRNVTLMHNYAWSRDPSTPFNLGLQNLVPLICDYARTRSEIRLKHQGCGIVLPGQGSNNLGKGDRLVPSNGRMVISRGGERPIQGHFF
jgi:hypothetical protein